METPAPGPCVQFGIPLTIVASRYQEGLIPNIVRDMIYYLCLSAEISGIFSVRVHRKVVGAAFAKVNNSHLKFHFDSMEPHVVAELFLRYLREIPGGLVPSTYAPLLMEAAQERSVEDLRKAIASIPFPENKRLLDTILIFINYIASKSALNKMSLSDLAAIFGPICLRAPDILTNRISLSNTFEMMLIHHATLFKPPKQEEWTLLRQEEQPIIAAQRVQAINSHMALQRIFPEVQTLLGNLQIQLLEAKSQQEVEALTATLRNGLQQFSSYSHTLNRKPPRTHVSTYPKSTLCLNSGHYSTIGRRPTMEDAVIHIDDFNSDSPLLTADEGRAIWAVYDGHGGTRVHMCRCPLTVLGAEVSLLASEMLHKEFVYFLATAEGANVPLCLDRAIKKTDKYICQKSLQNNFKSGSTMVLVYLSNTTLYVANLGDSETVMGRAIGDKKKNYNAVLLSYPHKPASPEEKMRIEALGGFVSPNGRVFGQLAVSRSLGDVHMKKPRVSENYVSNDAYIATFQLQRGDDFVVLACDGLWDVMTYQQAVDIIAKEKKRGTDSATTAKILVEKAFNDGSTDNISAIVVYLDWFQKSSEEK